MYDIQYRGVKYLLRLKPTGVVGRLLCENSLQSAGLCHERIVRGPVMLNAVSMPSPSFVQAKKTTYYCVAITIHEVDVGLVFMYELTHKIGRRMALRGLLKCCARVTHTDIQVKINTKFV